MGCCNYCRTNPCSCASPDCPDVQGCVDPTSIEIGSYLPVLDYQFCLKRLPSNQFGFLVNQPSSGGTPNITFTDSPCINLPSLTVGLNDSFNGIISVLGSDGCWRKVVTESGMTGWLRSDGAGGVYFQELPSEEPVPDPLQVNDLIVNDTATITNLVVGETLCFTNLPSGTVTDAVGLNEDGCLVKGALVTIAMALYYENASLTSSNTPNLNKEDDDNAEIGHEIYDPGAVAHVTSATLITIDKAGGFRIDWLGMFAVGSASNYNVALDLLINGTLVALGCGRSQPVGESNSVPRSARIHGIHMTDLQVGDTIALRVGKSASGASRLMDVKLTLELLDPA